MHADVGHTPALFRPEVVYEGVVAKAAAHHVKQCVKAPHASVGFQTGNPSRDRAQATRDP